METIEQRTHRVRHQMKFRMAQVKEVNQLSPRMVSVTLAGEDLKDFASAGADDHMKLLFPAEGQEKPDLPVLTDEGPRYPEGAIQPERRDFTPRRFDPERGELEVEFVLHGDGPAASWAAQAAPGQYLGIAGPRGSHVVQLDFDWYLLIGDETALPFIARQLEELPAGSKAIAIIEVEDEAEERALTSQAEVRTHWVHRNGTPAGSTDLLLQAVRNTEFLDGEHYTWVAGEANSLRDIRRHLLNERGLSREYTRFNGHWKYRVADWDHHEPIEE